ncbi:MAG: hypothetical protein H6845_02265 [Alphaproteobacteria bacterium]|nr:MAG: hypothetical protein H6845_02265 [Alphaproteobacteria bacterium]
MKSSNFFLALRRDVNEGSMLTNLMIKGGTIQKLASGIYSWLPLGYAMLSKIEKIVSDSFEEMGFNRMCIPTLHPSALWKKSGRYEAYGQETLRVYDRKNNEFIYGPSAEEPCVEMVKQANIKSSDLPINLFNIQWKFRDELRPRFGVIRGREFLMCDGYSFHETIDQSSDFYDQVLLGYKKMFQKMNLDVIVQEAQTGEIGGVKSHEFIINSETGEEEIEHNGTRIKALELGHIFLLGDHYSKPMGLSITNRDNKNIPLIMGCYGVGISRLVAALIEQNHQDGVISLPKQVAPFQIMLINAGDSCDLCIKTTNKIYNKYLDITLLDDRQISIGEKLATSDLIGSPIRIVVWPKELNSGQIEIRVNNKKQFIDVDNLDNIIKAL